MQASLSIRTLTQSTEWLLLMSADGISPTTAAKRMTLTIQGNSKEEPLLKVAARIDDHQNQATDLVQIQDSRDRQPQAPLHKQLC